MNEVQINQNVKILKKRRATIASLESKEQNNALLQSGKQATGDVGDTDLAADLAEQEVALTLSKMETIEIVKIDAAIERARVGDYGICEVCGQPIAAQRLALIPEASWCTGCEPNDSSRHRDSFHST